MRLQPIFISAENLKVTKQLPWTWQLGGQHRLFKPFRVHSSTIAYCNRHNQPACIRFSTSCLQPVHLSKLGLRINRPANRVASSSGFENRKVTPQQPLEP